MDKLYVYRLRDKTGEDAMYVISLMEPHTPESVQLTKLHLIRIYEQIPIPAANKIDRLVMNYTRRQKLLDNCCLLVISK